MYCCFCRDVCDILVDGLDSYRTVRDSIGAGALAQMSAAARERAFAAELRAMGALHPALCVPDGHYRVRLCGAARWCVLQER